jgi:hypothetical protein
MRQVFLIFSCGAMVLTGCGKAASIKTYPVKGTVTYNGQPLDGASVVYLPRNPDSPRTSGSTDADGKFSLNTFVSASEILQGAPADEYKVLVTKVKAPQDAPGMDPGFQSLPEQDKQKRMQQMMSGPPPAAGGPTEKQEQTGPTNLVPAKYSDSKTTPLTDVVVVGNNEPREFKLTDD